MGLKTVTIGRLKYTTGRWVREFVESQAQQQTGDVHGGPGALTDLELQQAAFALSIIEERGNDDEFEYIVSEHVQAERGNGRWVPDSTRYIIGCEWFAEKLAGLLGEPKARCLRAAHAVFSGDRQRAVFHAILAYAAELTQQQRHVRGEPDLLDQFNRCGLARCWTMAACAGRFRRPRPRADTTHSDGRPRG